MNMRRVNDHDELVGVLRMAVEASNETVTSNVERMLEQMAEAQEAMAEAQNETLAAISDVLLNLSNAVEALQVVAQQPPVVHVPETPLTVEMHQQPVNVDLQPAQVNVTPTLALDAPPPEVKVIQEIRPLPDKVNVRHSDGTRSIITFEE